MLFVRQYDNPWWEEIRTTAAQARGDRSKAQKVALNSTRHLINSFGFVFNAFSANPSQHIYPHEIHHHYPHRVGGL
jgi:hypothetical protein